MNNRRSHRKSNAGRLLVTQNCTFPHQALKFIFRQGRLERHQQRVANPLLVEKAKSMEKPADPTKPGEAPKFFPEKK